MLICDYFKIKDLLPLENFTLWYDSDKSGIS